MFPFFVLFMGLICFVDLICRIYLLFRISAMWFGVIPFTAPVAHVFFVGCPFGDQRGNLQWLRYRRGDGWRRGHRFAAASVAYVACTAEVSAVRRRTEVLHDLRHLRWSDELHGQLDRVVSTFWTFRVLLEKDAAGLEGKAITIHA